MRSFTTMAVLLLALAAAGAAAALHVRLEMSWPSADEVLTEPPTQLRLRFSGRIEHRYSAVTLSAPDGHHVPLGTLDFVPGSDREFAVAMSPLRAPGVYTVRWRTAGADGHVLEGSFAFTLDPETAPGADPADTTAAARGAPHHAPAEHHDHHVAQDASATGALPIFGRWLHFTALALLLGALAARTLLLPRLVVGDVTRRALQRRAWRGLAAAALLLAAAAILRLWLQSVALHGAGRAWDSRLLSILLTDTSWGRVWVLQAFFFALLGAGIALARPPRDTWALALVVPAALGLATVPALSGHAVGGTGFAALAALAVVNDALHVLGVGAWLGLLALLLTTILPAVHRHEAAPAAAGAHAVERFSPIALTAAAVVVSTGIINALMHVSAFEQLWSTRYGIALLSKLAILSFVVVSGFYNWRVLRPRLADAGHALRLRVTAGFELAIAALVLLATAFLTGLPRP
jgi:putative copper export protein/methionine-rich copper-binding protein CopC